MNMHVERRLHWRLLVLSAVLTLFTSDYTFAGSSSRAVPTAATSSKVAVSTQPTVSNVNFDKTISPVQTTSAHPILTYLWGTPTPEPRLTLGMWSLHSGHKKRNGHNQMFGFSYKGWFAGTFVNSYYLRAYAAGIQRFWFTHDLPHDANYQLGYRLGLVTGYEGHNLTGLECLRNAPAIPFAQLVLAMNWKFLGIELSSPNPQVISLSFYLRF